MTREEIRMVASIIANSDECRAWIRDVESLDTAHDTALNWGVDNTPASSPARHAIVQFATQFAGAAHTRVPTNVLDRIENLVRYYTEHDYDPSVEVQAEPMRPRQHDATRAEIRRGRHG